MAYTLTLTKSERKAFDWVGHRYVHGDQMADILRRHMPDIEDLEWDTDQDITFDLPENAAWEIQDLAQEGDYQFDCFAPELREKMMGFLCKIV